MHLSLRFLTPFVPPDSSPPPPRCFDVIASWQNFSIARLPHPCGGSRLSVSSRGSGGEPMAVATSTLLGRPLWYELMTTDMKAAEAFYRNVVGWKTTPFDGAGQPYTMFNRGARRVRGRRDDQAGRGARRRRSGRCISACRSSKRLRRRSSGSAARAHTEVIEHPDRRPHADDDRTRRARRSTSIEPAARRAASRRRAGGRRGVVARADDDRRARRR